MSARGTVHLLLGPPGTGKTTIQSAVAAELNARTGKRWIYLDNEWCFTRKQRVLCSRRSGLQLDTDEFSKTFGIPGREAYQGLIANLAGQGLNVLATAPFEDLTYDSNGMPRYTELSEVIFYESCLRCVYILLWPSSDPKLDSKTVLTDPSMNEIEAIVHERLFARSLNDADQRSLDLRKLNKPDYYRQRASLVLETARQFNIPIVKISPIESAASIATRVAKAFEGPVT